MPDIILATTFNAALPIAPIPGFEDTFNRADGPVGSTSAESRAWQMQTSATPEWPLVVAGNAAKRGTGSTAPRTLWTVDGYAADGEITAVIGALGDSTHALLLRAQDPSNWISVQGRDSSSTRTYRLVKCVNGTTTKVSSGTQPTTAAGDVVRVTMVGTSITVRVNGVVVFGGPLTVPEFVTNTRHGILLQAGSSGEETWDSIKFVAA